MLFLVACTSLADSAFNTVSLPKGANTATPTPILDEQDDSNFTSVAVPVPAPPKIGTMSTLIMRYFVPTNPKPKQGQLLIPRWRPHKRDC